MSYDHPRCYKAEENLGREITESVVSHICDFYGVETVHELTVDQIAEVEEFRTNVLSEYSILQWGYSDAIAMWEWELQEGAPLQ